MGAEARPRSPLHPPPSDEDDAARRSSATSDDDDEDEDEDDVTATDRATDRATDLATDLSRRTDKTSISIPADGRPLTIDTERLLGSAADPDHSQTSLLIEFFGGGKNPQVTARPSVHVRVSPSTRRRTGPATADDTPTATRHIVLRPGETHIAHAAADADDANADAAPHPDLRAPDAASDLSATSTSISNPNYYSNLNPSDLSSMPPESALDPPAPVPAAAVRTPPRARSRSLTPDASGTARGALDVPAARDANLSRERLTQKVIEKLGHEPRRATAGKTRSRSVSKEHLEESAASPRRRSGKHRRTSGEHGSDPSLLTASQVSESRSFRSGTSKSSYNNPKLLETVEDAIRRLILPELTALKEQKTQKNLEKFEHMEQGRRRLSAASGSTESREELTRRLSKHASDPNVSSVRRKRRTQHAHGTTTERFERGASEETVIRDEGKPPRRRSSKDGHGVRDAAAGALAGSVLTREALRHHDSQSSVERRERRRRRSSKSHSRSHSRHDSTADTDELFYKHDVPPMPMRSELTGSDLTRDSILSERIATTPTSERRHHEIRQIARTDPRRANVKEMARELDRRSGADFKYRDVVSEDSEPRRPSQLRHEYGHDDVLKAGAATAAAAAVGAGAAKLATYHSDGAHYYDELDEHPYGGGHTLSPIQSVNSLEEAGEPHQQKLRRVHSTGSLESLERHDVGTGHRSIDSPSHDDVYLHKQRNQGLGVAGLRDLGPHSFASPERYDADYDQDAMDLDSPHNAKHISYGTSSEVPSDLDKVTTAQAIRDLGANPEYIGTPLAVESAVASLHGSSVLDFDSAPQSRTGERAQSEPLEGTYGWGGTAGIGSPLKNELRHDGLHTTTTRDDPGHSMDKSRSAAYPERYEPVSMSHSGAPDLNDPLPEIGHYASKSDISTNPSYIQGTAGGYDTDKDAWMLSPNQREKVRSDDDSAHDSFKDAARNMLIAAAAGAGAGAALAQQGGRNVPDATRGVSDPYSQTHYYDEGRDARAEDVFTPESIDRNSVDEGYVTGAQFRSPSLTPDHRKTRAPSSGGPAVVDARGDMDDPFQSSHKHTISASSQGQDAFYDSAMGTGLDRIQSQDIVALMNHLTVRDAQRSARDTEMLTTLVQSAAEMRNSFEDMKRFIREQDDFIVEIGNKQHEKTQRVLNGPRPLPSSTTRLPRSSAEDIAEDVPQKRRNAFRRALKGFGGRSNNDIARLEVLLNHLLEEVAELKAAQGINTTSAAPTNTYRSTGLTSYENLRDGPPSGYEPEGQAGTGSTADNSGYFSAASTRQGSGLGFGRRRASENRVSTVLEADEEDEGPLEPHEQEVLDFENSEQLLTPTRQTRNTSVPFETPPGPGQAPAAISAENTPRTDKSKKHKSSNSSFFPKFSRWSRTTASTVADNVRGSARRERPYSQVSHSGSELQQYDVSQNYDPQGDDRLRSSTSLNQDRPPSPLVPSAVSDKPTYQAHRNSINLQHPRPRQGPTAQYLESQVQHLAQDSNVSPITPTSDQFGSNPVLARFNGGAGNRLSGQSAGGQLSPILDHGCSEASQTPPPPRPPKIRDEGPLVPPKVPVTEGKPSYSERAGPSVSFAPSNDSTLAATRSPNQRKPSGPRAMTGRAYTPERTTPSYKNYRSGANEAHLEEDVTF